MAKYLITGGAGFIGSHLADALVARGDSVVCLDDMSTGVEGNLSGLKSSSSFEFVRGSILDFELLSSLVARVDHVVHMAAAVGVFTIVDKPLESLTTNLRGTENVLEAALKFSKPVFIASTSEIYGKNGGEALSEESDRIIGSPLKSRWSYSEAKAIDESLGYFYYVEKGLPVRLARFFNTVGPRQVGHYGMVVPRFVKAALDGSPLTVYGSGTQSRCFCHVSDAVRAVLLILDSEKTVGDVFNIGNNHEVSIKQLADHVINTLGSSSTVEMVPYEKAYAPGFEDMQRRVPNISKIERVLGWKPEKDLTQIVRDIAAHMKG